MRLMCIKKNQFFMWAMFLFKNGWGDKKKPFITQI
jgi:hypothetical protein